MAKITVVAIMKAQADKVEEVKTALLECAVPTRQEEGNINYDLHQSLADPAEFMMHENWASKDALNAHGKTPHMAALFGAIGDKLADKPKIMLFSEVK